MPLGLVRIPSCQKKSRGSIRGSLVFAVDLSLEMKTLAGTSSLVANLGSPFFHIHHRRYHHDFLIKSFPPEPNNNCSQ
eukprot:9179619-Ditylum_brightwellii.AAC.1